MFIYVHQGRFSSTRDDCVNSSVFIFYQYIHTHASFNAVVDAEGGPVSGKNRREILLLYMHIN
jgi:hypothetical protein